MSYLRYSEGCPFYVYSILPVAPETRSRLVIEAAGPFLGVTGMSRAEAKVLRDAIDDWLLDERVLDAVQDDVRHAIWMGYRECPHHPGVLIQKRGEHLCAECRARSIDGKEDN